MCVTHAEKVLVKSVKSSNFLYLESMTASAVDSSAENWDSKVRKVVSSHVTFWTVTEWLAADTMDAGSDETSSKDKDFLMSLISVIEIVHTVPSANVRMCVAPRDIGDPSQADEVHMPHQEAKSPERINPQTSSPDAGITQDSIEQEATGIDMMKLL